MTETPALGSRGGRLDQADLDRITAIYQETRSSEFGDVCRWIVTTAATAGEYHGDAASDWQIESRNVLGIAVRHLVANGVLESTGEHRPGTSAASHRRRSYVYRLTPLGEQAAKHWPKPTWSWRHRLDGHWPDDQPAQATLDIEGAIRDEFLV